MFPVLKAIKVHELRSQELRSVQGGYSKDEFFSGLALVASVSISLLLGKKYRKYCGILQEKTSDLWKYIEHTPLYGPSGYDKMRLEKAMYHEPANPTMHEVAKKVLEGPYFVDPASLSREDPKVFKEITKQILVHEPASRIPLQTPLEVLKREGIIKKQENDDLRIKLGKWLQKGQHLSNHVKYYYKSEDAWEQTQTWLTEMGNLSQHGAHAIREIKSKHNLANVADELEGQWKDLSEQISQKAQDQNKTQAALSKNLDDLIRRGSKLYNHMQDIEEEIEKKLEDTLLDEIKFLASQTEKRAGYMEEIAQENRKKGVALTPEEKKFYYEQVMTKAFISKGSMIPSIVFEQLESRNEITDRVIAKALHEKSSQAFPSADIQPSSQPKASSRAAYMVYNEAETINVCLSIIKPIRRNKYVFQCLTVIGALGSLASLRATLHAISHQRRLNIRTQNLHNFHLGEACRDA